MHKDNTVCMRFVSVLYKKKMVEQALRLICRRNGFVWLPLERNPVRRGRNGDTKKKKRKEKQGGSEAVSKSLSMRRAGRKS